jgi:hypothetical protein
VHQLPRHLRPPPPPPAPRRVRPARVRTLLASLASAAALAAGCGGGPPAFVNTFPSKEAAAGAVVQALAARDVRRLEALAVSEDEFKTRVWPALPASVPAFGMPADYAWADTAAKSHAALSSLVAANGGRRFEVERVSFGDTPRDYGPFRVHPRAQLEVRDATGARGTARLFGSMLEAEGRWKVFSYVAD